MLLGPCRRLERLWLAVAVQGLAASFCCFLRFEAGIERHSMVCVGEPVPLLCCLQVAVFPDYPVQPPVVACQVIASTLPLSVALPPAPPECLTSQALPQSRVVHPIGHPNAFWDIQNEVQTTALHVCSSAEQKLHLPKHSCAVLLLTTAHWSLHTSAPVYWWQERLTLATLFGCAAVCSGQFVFALSPDPCFNLTLPSLSGASSSLSASLISNVIFV